MTDHITVIVYGARGLKGKKKGNIVRCQFSVIFGVGKNKFRTEIVEDQGGAPEWQTQSDIVVENNKNPLLFVVTEKDNALGQISLPLHELPTVPSRQRIVTALEPHKKCPEPSGELIYAAWISSNTNAEDEGARTPVIKKKGFAGSMENFGRPLKKIKEKLSHSPMLKRKMSLRRQSGGNPDSDSEDKDSLGSLNSLASSMSVGSRNSASTQELTKPQASPSLSSKLSSGLGTPPTAPKSSMKSAMSMSALTLPSQMSHRRSNSFTDIDNTMLPEISGISPKEGPIDGGTKLTIRGANLGKDKADVVGLFVCGSNLLGSVEYISSSKLVCTTKPWKPSKGHIVIETQSGGKGTSLVQFTFTEPKPIAPEVDLDHPPEELSIITPPPKPKRKVKENKDMFDLTQPTALSEETAASVKQHRRTGSGVSDSGTPVTSPPEVSGISPREGPLTGGTRLTIRGAHLGNCKEDIIGLFVCGCNCLPSLEYDSPSKLFCTTKTWKKGSGSIVIETQGGGQGSSLVQFTFIEPPPPPSQPSPVAQQRVPERSQATMEETDNVKSVPTSVPTSNVAVVNPLGNNTTEVPKSRLYTETASPFAIIMQSDTDTSNNQVVENTNNYNLFDNEADETDNFRAIPFEPEPASYQPPMEPVERVSSKPPKGPAPKPPVSQMVIMPAEDRSEKEKMLKDRCEQLEASNVLLSDQLQVLRIENKVLRGAGESMREYIERLVAIVMEKCPECLNRDLRVSTC